MNTEIFKYLDYKELLNDLGDELIRSHSYSWRKISKEAQLGAPNFIKQIINGQRKLNDNHIQKLIAFFRWSDKEADFFKTLIQFNEEDEIQLKNRLFQKLLSFKKFNSIQQIERDRYEYFAHWYHPVIRELCVLCPSHKEAVSFVESKINPNPGTVTIKHSIKLLENLGFIYKFKDRYKQSEEVISTPSQVNSLLAKNYHLEILNQAQEALTRVPREARDFRTICLSISPDKEAELKKRIESFWLDTLDWCHSENHSGKSGEKAKSGDEKQENKVSQLCFQFFPFTK